MYVRSCNAGILKVECHLPHHVTSPTVSCLPLGKSGGGHDTVVSSPQLRIKRVSCPPPHYLTQVNTCVISPTVCLTFRTFRAILKQAKKRGVWGRQPPSNRKHKKAAGLGGGSHPQPSEAENNNYPDIVANPSNLNEQGVWG